MTQIVENFYIITFNAHSNYCANSLKRNIDLSDNVLVSLHFFSTCVLAVTVECSFTIYLVYTLIPNKIVMFEFCVQLV